MSGFRNIRGQVPDFRGVGTARVQRAQGGGGGVGPSLLNMGSSLLHKYALGQLKETEQKIKTKQAAAGTKAGLQAVQNGTSLALREDNDTVAGAAFNRGAEQSYLTALGLDIRQEADKYQQKHDADPNGFTTAFSAYSEKLLKTAPENLRPALQLELMARRGEKLRQINKTFQKREIEKQQVTILSGLEAFGQDYENAWRRGDTQSAQEAFARFDGSLSEAVDNGRVSAERAVRMRTHLRDEGEKQTVLGDFERTLDGQGLEAGKDYIARFKKTQKSMDPDLKDRIVARLEGDLASKVADRKVLDRELGQKTAAVISVIEKGYEPRGLEGLRDEIKGTKWEAQLDAALADRDYIQAFAKQPPHTQQSVLEKLSQGKQTKRSASLLGRLERTAAHTRSALEKDALGHAIDVGAVEAPAQLDFSKPDQLIPQMRQRNRAALKVKETYGVDALPFTGGEINQIENMLANSDAAGKTQILAALHSGVGANHMRSLSQKLAPKQPAFAVAARLSVEDPQLASDLLESEQILAADPKLKPKPVDWSRTAYEYFDTALSASREQQALMTQSALSLYARETARTGRQSEAFNQDLFEDMLDRVTGGMVEWKDQRIFPPVRGMKQDEFEKFMDTLSEEDLQAFSIGGVQPTWGDGKAVPVDYFKRHAVLVSYAPGQYRVRMGNGMGLNGGLENGEFGLSFDRDTVLARLGKAKSTDMARVK